MLRNHIKGKANGVAIDSLVLTFVKVLTSLLGIITTKILSTKFALSEYGTYSEVTLIVSTATSISIMGLTDATRYFYNSTNDKKERQIIISTIFGMQYLFGTLTGLIILLSKDLLAQYFKNQAFSSNLEVIIAVALMPLMANLIAMIQVLFISTGRAKTIAIRNTIVSVSRLAFVLITSYLTQNINLFFILLIMLDIIQVIFFYVSLYRQKIIIRLSQLSIKYIMPILKFGIPMTVSIFTSALAKDIDKYVISFFTNTEYLALYSNAAKYIPYDLIAISFFTVLLPIITRQTQSDDILSAQATVKSYFRIGYLTTWPLVASSIVAAKELMIVLYDEKFLSVLPIFIIYLAVDLFRFSNFWIIIAATGKTMILMVCSVTLLLANGVLDIILYFFVGPIGPAIATLFITIVSMMIYMHIGRKELKASYKDLLDLKEVSIVAGELIIFMFIAYFIGKLLNSFIDQQLIVLSCVFIIVAGGFLLFNWRRIYNCVKTINSVKYYDL